MSPWFFAVSRAFSLQLCESAKRSSLAFSGPAPFSSMDLLKGRHPENSWQYLAKVEYCQRINDDAVE